jgi:hypothetical protein
MNQRGDSTLFCILLLLALSSLVILCSLELKRSFSLLEKRAHILLCVKETKGEINRYLKFMGRTNWAIENINRARLIMMLIPGLQGAALSGDKLKDALIHLQDASLILYFKTINDLKKRSCPIDPRMLLTPFEIELKGYKRDLEGAAKLRKKEWSYYFLHLPYAVSLEVTASSYKRIKPKIKYQFKESEVTSSLLSSFAY